MSLIIIIIIIKIIPSSNYNNKDRPNTDFFGKSVKRHICFTIWVLQK